MAFAARPLPKVLIIGDSISMGYTPFVAEALAEKAVVVHNSDPNNAASTAHGVEHVETWLGDGQWDVIHFNWGLWDICRRINGERNLDGPLTATLEEYTGRLETLVARLERTRATLIWASTTYCTGGWGRIRGDDDTYNAAAAAVMRRHDVRTNDLHALTATFPEELFLSKGDVHYTDEGYRVIAKQVASAILAVLGA